MKRSNASNKRAGKSPRSRKASATPVRTTLSAYQVERLTRIENEYTARIAAARATLLGLGTKALGLFTGLPQLLKGKGKKGKGGGGHGKPGANPQQVLQVVQGALTNLKVVGNTGNLVIGEFNAEFGDANKANTYAASYAEIVTRHHLLLMEEVDFGFLQTVGKANGYGYFCSSDNGRGQCVGFLVHPRLRVLNKTEYMQVAQVQGIPQLRPALELELEDSVTGTKFSAVVVHLKSMRGGPVATAPVRYQQCQIIASLFTGKSLIIGGDWNTFLNNTTDTQPLVKAGYKLVYPGDSTSTQSMGGRLDGFFSLNLAQKLGRYQIRNFWKNKTIGRGFSDHGLVTVQMYMCGTGGSGTDCSNGAGDPDGEVSTN